MSKRNGYVHFYCVIGTPTVVACVYERMEGLAERSHSSITTIKGVWYGHLGTRTLPADVEALPAGEARSAACASFRDMQKRLAHRLIADAARGFMAEEEQASGVPSALGSDVEWFDQALAEKVDALGDAAYVAITYEG